MTDPIDKGSVPVSSSIVRWALVFAIIGLIWAVYSGFGSLKCICDRLDGVVAGLKEIAENQSRAKPGPGGGAGTISIGTGSGGGNAAWSITSGGTTRDAMKAGSAIIRYDAIGQRNVFQARQSATMNWIDIQKYTIKIKKENTDDIYTLVVEGVFPNQLTWTITSPTGSVLPLTTCGPTPACTGDLPDELFGTVTDFSFTPVSGTQGPGTWTVRSQTVVE